MSLTINNIKSYLNKATSLSENVALNSSGSKLTQLKNSSSVGYSNTIELKRSFITALTKDLNTLDANVDLKNKVLSFARSKLGIENVDLNNPNLASRKITLNDKSGTRVTVKTLREIVDVADATVGLDRTIKDGFKNGEQCNKTLRMFATLAKQPEFEPNKLRDLMLAIVKNTDKLGRVLSLDFLAKVSDLARRDTMAMSCREALGEFLKLKLGGIDDQTLKMLGTSDLFSLATDAVINDAPANLSSIKAYAKRTADEVTRQNYTSKEVQEIMRLAEKDDQAVIQEPDVTFSPKIVKSIKFENGNASKQCLAFASLTSLISKLLHTEDTWNQDALTPAQRVKYVLERNVNLLEHVNYNGLAIASVSQIFTRAAGALGVTTDAFNTAFREVASTLKEHPDGKISDADAANLAHQLEIVTNEMVKMANAKLVANFDEAAKKMGLTGNLGSLPEGVKPENIDLLEIAQRKNPSVPGETERQKAAREAKIMDDYAKLTMDMQAGGMGSLIGKIATKYLSEISYQEKSAMISGAFAAFDADFFAQLMDGKELTFISGGYLSLRLTSGQVANDAYMPEYAGRLLGGILKGSGPVLQKMVQMLGADKISPHIAKAIKECKSHLKPLPESYVNAKLDELKRLSGGKITDIKCGEVKGSASIGVAYRCSITNDKGVTRNCIVKILRPDVAGRMNREIDALERIAREEGEGALRTLQARISSLRGELDFAVEQQNLRECGQIYDHATGSAPFRNLASAKLADGVPQLSDVLVMEEAPGDTYEKYMDGVKEKVDNLAARYLEKNPVTGKFKKKVVSTEEFNRAKEEVTNLYNDVYKKQYRLQRFVQTWFANALYGDGKFHGDLHAGNIMIDDATNLLTVIDFGNAPQFSKSDRKNVVKFLTAAANGNVNGFLNSFKKLVPRESQQVIDNNRIQLESVFNKAFSASTLAQAGSRIKAGLGELSRRGAEVPAALYNFAEAFMRISQLSDSMLSTLHQMEGILPLLEEKVDAKPNMPSLLSAEASPASVANKAIAVGMSKVHDLRPQDTDGELFARLKEMYDNKDINFKAEINNGVQYAYDTLSNLVTYQRLEACLRTVAKEVCNERGRVNIERNDPRWDSAIERGLKQMKSTLIDFMQYFSDTDESLLASTERICDLLDEAFADHELIKTCIIDRASPERMKAGAPLITSEGAGNPVVRPPQGGFISGAYNEIANIIVKEITPKIRTILTNKVDATMQGKALGANVPVTTMKSIAKASLRNPFSAAHLVGVGTALKMGWEATHMKKVEDLPSDFNFARTQFDFLLQKGGVFVVGDDRRLATMPDAPMTPTKENANARRALIETLRNNTKMSEKEFFASDEYRAVASVLGLGNDESMGTIEKAMPLTGDMVKKCFEIHDLHAGKAENKENVNAA